MRAAVLVAWAVTLGGALPGLWLGWQWLSGGLGVVPDEALLHWTGRFALVGLVATLALGPLQIAAQWRPLYAARRPLGLWAFGYGGAHLAVWALRDQGGVWAFIRAEVATMAHVQLGLVALGLLVPLALTSTAEAVRRLTLPRWSALHLLVWPATLVALVHAWMVARFDSPLVVALGTLTLAMLTTRLIAAARARG